MPKFIDKNSIRFIKAPIAPLIPGGDVTYHDIAFKVEIDNIPTADVEPIRESEWITSEPLPRTYGRRRAICARCGCFALYEFINVGSFGEKLTKFCPDCGGKMNLKERLNNE